ncbi:hypothetical protein BVY03_04605 [bacterium K02(2017)]|nr:hypothetical protein BVY03_04605 [bacterium K02(2017)]
MISLPQTYQTSSALITTAHLFVPIADRARIEATSTVPHPTGILDPNHQTPTPVVYLNRNKAGQFDSIVLVSEELEQKAQRILQKTQRLSNTHLFGGKQPALSIHHLGLLGSLQSADVDNNHPDKAVSTESLIKAAGGPQHLQIITPERWPAIYAALNSINLPQHFNNKFSGLKLHTNPDKILSSAQIYTGDQMHLPEFMSETWYAFNQHDFGIDGFFNNTRFMGTLTMNIYQYIKAIQKIKEQKLYPESTETQKYPDVDDLLNRAWGLFESLRLLGKEYQLVKDHVQTIQEMVLIQLTVEENIKNSETNKRALK